MVQIMTNQEVVTFSFKALLSGQGDVPLGCHVHQLSYK